MSPSPGYQFELATAKQALVAADAAIQQDLASFARRAKASGTSTAAALAAMKLGFYRQRCPLIAFFDRWWKRHKVRILQCLQTQTGSCCTCESGRFNRRDILRCSAASCPERCQSAMRQYELGRVSGSDRVPPGLAWRQTAGSISRPLKTPGRRLLLPPSPVTSVKMVEIPG